MSASGQPQFVGFFKSSTGDADPRGDEAASIDRVRYSPKMFDRSLAFLLECFSLRGTLKLVSFYGTTKEAAEKLGILGEIRGKRPSAAKAGIDSVGFMQGLKPPPPSGSSFSAACKVVP
jgi:hypothetical protein